MIRIHQLSYLYEQLLEFRISRYNLPSCVAIVLSSGDLDETGLKLLRDLIDWSISINLKSLAIYINEHTQETYRMLVSELSDMPAEILLHTSTGIERLGKVGKIKVEISLGYGGKKEVTEAIKRLLEDVEAGRIKPDEIDESTIEANLRFRQKPDLVIRAGGRQLSDFMIWQSVYSELYFTEVNWHSFSKTDFLRAIRDCQKRERRFGR
ncbi:MAG: undecaprenyl diphosphate synthase family protein [Methanotrichaceae archaeon]